MFIRKKKLLKMLKEEQKRINEENRKVKLEYWNKNDEISKRKARDWQFFEDGNDNAFNFIIGRINRKW